MTNQPWLVSKSSQKTCCNTPMLKFRLDPGAVVADHVVVPTAADNHTEAAVVRPCTTCVVSPVLLSSAASLKIKPALSTNKRKKENQSCEWHNNNGATAT